MKPLYAALVSLAFVVIANEIVSATGNRTFIWGQIIGGVQMLIYFALIYNVFEDKPSK